VRADKKKYALASRTLHYETNPYNARPLLQRDRFDLGGVWFNPPSLPLETADMDELYDLPFNRAPHPMYGDASVPAFETVKNSLVIMRGCFGGCTFCSITEHEGASSRTAPADGVRGAARDAPPGRGERRGQRSRRPDGEHVPDALRGREVLSQVPSPVGVHPTSAST
jgi:hypothetical protein